MDGVAHGNRLPDVLWLTEKGSWADTGFWEGDDLHGGFQSGSSRC